MAYSSFISQGHVSTGDLATAAAHNITLDNIASLTGGPHHVPIPIHGFRPHDSGGCAALENLLLSAGRYVSACAFDATSIESTSLTLPMPKAWNEGTIAYIPYWLNTAGGAGGVVWNLAAVAASDDDTLDVAVGTAQISIDTALAAKKNAKGPQSSAITIAGTPVANDNLRLVLQRDPTHASDTYASDAYFVSLLLIITMDQPDDS